MSQREPTPAQQLARKIETKSAHVAVIGAGYAGLPLVAELLQAGYRVTALDSDAERVRLLNEGESYIKDVPAARLAPHVAARRLRATSDRSVLREVDVALICVQTPLDARREPDIRHIRAAVDAIAEHQHSGMLVVLESTTYPGTTTEVLLPKLCERFRSGEDVFVGYSPQRVDPGNATYDTRTTPKVVSGATARCLELVTLLYAELVERVVPVSRPEVAELVKLFENTFRAVNIGLVNELALMSSRLGIDPFEVTEAAATKPFGFMPFAPGPGLGGHCIALDPLYLSWKLREHNFHARFIELAVDVNHAMPEHVVERAAAALNDHSLPLRGSRVLVYGVAYKRDVSDTRETPAVPILRALGARGAHVAYMDPLVPSLAAEGLELRSVSTATGFGEYDLVVLVTDHSALDQSRLLAEASLIVDTRGALRGAPERSARVYSL